MILTDTKPKNYISAAQYQVHFEDWDTLRSIIEDPIYSQVLVIADENTEKLCLHILFCLLYTSDAADERSSVDLGGRRIIKKKKKINMCE